MLLVIDVGNTNITLGVFDREELKATFRMTTQIARTSDEYGIILSDLLRVKNIQVEEIDSVIVASVVPKIMHSFTSGIIKYLKITPLIVGAGTKTGIKIAASNPKEIGADRVVDAVAAYELYGGPVLVIDFGTAITYDLITEDGSFIAGVTSPGLRISANALWNETAKLPEIEIAMPETILAKETVTSMQAGLVFGCIGQTEYIVKRMLEESGIQNCRVIATGGLGKIISDATDVIEVYDPNLTLKGLKIISDKNKSGR
ncbi:type III pantothenate kinase [Mobilitalea sibirica]|uniref:Type III pantothenate kinase n=1 Tax=Mobilitalea sibirica TaxID=1462919 RepID=A0A8J7H8R4_9FIRM|nr:type III pantothenate kinase [Mobilitalea sibirica]MBH1940460.1 type III pantothenate kinase [Mobilitalea sibirica]